MYCTLCGGGVKGWNNRQTDSLFEVSKRGCEEQGLRSSWEGIMDKWIDVSQRLEPEAHPPSEEISLRLREMHNTP